MGFSYFYVLQMFFSVYFRDYFLWSTSQVSLIISVIISVDAMSSTVMQDFWLAIELLACQINLIYWLDNLGCLVFA